MERDDYPQKSQNIELLVAVILFFSALKISLQGSFFHSNPQNGSICFVGFRVCPGCATLQDAHGEVEPWQTEVQ